MMSEMKEERVVLQEEAMFKNGLPTTTRERIIWCEGKEESSEEWKYNKKV